MIPTIKMTTYTTTQTMVSAFFCAILMSVPLYSWVFNTGWDWANEFPMRLLGDCISYMVTFFHELGHCLFAWFYGYPSVPMFDFAHGGGLTIWMDQQQYVLLGALYAALVFGIFKYRHDRFTVALFVSIIIFHVLTAYNEDARSVVISFMGPLAAPLMAAVFLLHALYNLIRHSRRERFFNALFGFAFIFHGLINGFGLLKSYAFRTVYFQQKGGHGLGDFDKISDHIPFLNFTQIIYIYIAINLACLIIPFIVYWRDAKFEDQGEGLPSQEKIQSDKG